MFCFFSLGKHRKTVNLVLQAVYGAYAARKSQNIVTWRLLEYLPINHKGLGFTEDILSEDLWVQRGQGECEEGGGSARQVNNKAKNGQKWGRAAAGEAKKGYQTYYY